MFDLSLHPTALVLVSYSLMKLRILNHSFLFIHVLIDLFTIEHLLHTRLRVGQWEVQTTMFVYHLHVYSAGTKNKIFVHYILLHIWTIAYLTRGILLLAFVYE